MKRLDLDIQLFATSGVFYTNKPSGKYLKVTWYSTQNSSGNYSYVTANVYAVGGTVDSLLDGQVNLTIDGTVYSKSVYKYINAGNEHLLFTQSKTVSHNAQGAKTLNMSVYTSGYSFPNEDFTDYNGSGSWPLPTILQYGEFTWHYAQTGWINYINVFWGATNTIDLIRYYLNGSSEPVYIDIADGTNGNYSIENLQPGTSYSVVTEIRRKDTQTWTRSDTASASTTQSAKITSNIYNVNSVSSLGVTIWNESGGQSDIYIELLNAERTQRIGNPIRHSNTTNTTFSVQEIQSLANLIPNTNTCNFRINTVNVINGQDCYLYYKDGTYSVVNANPIFSNFTYADSNSTAVGLTGDNQKVIKGYSNVKATVSSSNKATAQQGATMSKYRLVIGSKQVDANYSSSADVNLQLNNIDNNVFTLYAIDSRGNSTSKQISPSTFINYFDRYFSTPLPVAIRTDDIGSETTLSFNGLFFNNTFGTTQNDITLAYKYKKTSDSTYTDGVTPLTLVKDGNNFSFSNIIAGDLGANGFDANYSYNIRLVATDSLGITNYDFILGTGKPNIAISKNGVAINGAYDESIGGSLQVDGKAFGIIEKISNTSVNLSNIMTLTKPYTNYKMIIVAIQQYGLRANIVILTDQLIRGKNLFSCNFSSNVNDRRITVYFTSTTTLRLDTGAYDVTYIEDVYGIT